jgi:hypothetical protein
MTAAFYIISNLITGLMTSIITYLFTRKKYNADVAGININNITKSLQFYIKLVDDYNIRISSYIKDNETLAKKISQIEAALTNLLHSSCIDTKCSNRVLLAKDTLSYIKDEM